MGQIATMLHLGHADALAAAEGARRAHEGARRSSPGRAVAFIVVVGLVRGLRLSELLLLGTAMAISAIPTGLPAFVSGLLSLRRQAARRGQGGRQEPHRRRDARRDERDQHRQDRHADAEPDDGRRPSTRAARGSPSRARATRRPARSWRRGRAGARLHPARARPGARQRRDGRRRRRRSSATRRRRRWWCSPPSSGSTPRRPAAPTRAWPRCPFDSDYKFMATFHRVTIDGAEHVIELVKGAPDVVLARCTHAGWPAAAARRSRSREARAGIEAANARMGEKGLRVLAFAARLRRPTTSWRR